MDQEQHVTFGPFRIEMPAGRLWRDGQMLTLRPRSLAVLQYLVQHPGRVVTKDELRQHVWDGAHVTDTVLRVCIREIRVALDDSATSPQYVETVGQQGYKMLVNGDGNLPSPSIAGPIVDRQRELDTLEGYYRRMLDGERQVVFLSGEVGIGKRTVVDLFLARLASDQAVLIGRGQCVEPYGEVESYLPLLAALSGLCHGPEREMVLSVLRRYAPMWLLQLPGLVSDTELEHVQRQVQGAAQARMVRELSEMIEVLTESRPLVLVLEELHWSDNATVECLAYLAQRRDPAKLLILGTYRPVEAVLRAHPLRGMVQELCGRGQSEELRLEFLSAADVTAYANSRLGGAVSDELASLLHERTDGNALFLVNLVEYLVQQQLVEWQQGEWTLQHDSEALGLPEGLQQLILRRIEALPEEGRNILEAASVMGEVFTAAAVAAALQCAAEVVEAACEVFVTQQHFIVEQGIAVWPDGTHSGSYRFQHMLHRQVLYEQLGNARRAELHRRIGARMEAAYGDRAGEIAAQLAVHCEKGGDGLHAAHYLQQAAENAARRNAYQEALALLNKGLALLATLPDSSERDRRELALQLDLGNLLLPIQGRMAEEVRDAYSRATMLCEQVGDVPQRVRALWGLVQFHAAEAQLHSAAELSQQLFDLAQRQAEPIVKQVGHLAMGVVAFYRGDPIAARSNLEESLRLSNASQSPPSTLHAGFVPGVTPRTWLAQALWGLGYADQAQQWNREMLDLARQSGHLSSMVHANLFAAQFSQFCRDVAATLEYADTAMELAAEQGFELRVEQGRMFWGWALAMQGTAADGVAQLHKGFAVGQSIGPELFHPYWLSLLAESYSQAGQIDNALQAFDDALALVPTTEGPLWQAELWRLKGETLLKAEGAGRKVEEGETCFQQALAVARRQQARTLELRTVLSLCRLWQQGGQVAAARDLLGPIYDWFSEGFDTPDLREAKAFLEVLRQAECGS